MFLGKRIYGIFFSHILYVIVVTGLAAAGCTLTLSVVILITLYICILHRKKIESKSSQCHINNIYLCIKILDTMESPDNVKLKQNDAYEYRMPIKNNPAYEYCQQNIHACL